MDNVLSYHVLHGRTGRWLAEDEHTWTNDLTCSAAFTSAELAQVIGERETDPLDSIYVMACLGMISTD